MRRPLFEHLCFFVRIRSSAPCGTALFALSLGLAACDDATSPGGASGLTFAVQPASTDVESSLAPGLPGVTVVIQDDEGLTVPEWTEPVTLSLVSGSAGALTGTTTVEPVGGTAVFPDLQVTEAGSAYQLVARSGRLTEATSETFDVHTVFTSASVASGEDHTCALTDDGTAYCWGANAFGQLGDGTRTDRSTPVAVQTGETFMALAAEGSHTCGLTETGTAFCWGENRYGQLGTETTETCTHPTEGDVQPCSPLPLAVNGGRVWDQLAAGSFHTCGLTPQGEMHCWGSNSVGQLGVGDGVNESLTPLPVSGGHRFVIMDAGRCHSCGLEENGKVYCWGRNFFGEVGDDSWPTERYEPVPVVGDQQFVFLSLSGLLYPRTCAITAEGRTYCWGRGYYDVEISSRFVTVPSPLIEDPGFETVAAGGYMTCGLTPEGALHCWGEGEHGRLGTGGVRSLSHPTAVLPEKRFASVSPGRNHTCAVSVEGVTYCWGLNDRGQLGREPRPTGWTVPMPVWAN